MPLGRAVVVDHGDCRPISAKLDPVAGGGKREVAVEHAELRFAGAAAAGDRSLVVEQWRRVRGIHRERDDTARVRWDRRLVVAVGERPIPALGEPDDEVLAAVLRRRRVREQLEDPRLLRHERPVLRPVVRLRDGAFRVDPSDP